MNTGIRDHRSGLATTVAAALSVLLMLGSAPASAKHDIFHLVRQLIDNGGVGAPGPTGAVGPTGPRGYAGADGADGITGADGDDGVDGTTGPAGADGAPGEAGPAGADGAAGARGLAGADGASGATGPAGEKGVTGLFGLAGNDGARGPTGPAGADGATGPRGPTGLDTLGGLVCADGDIAVFEVDAWVCESALSERSRYVDNGDGTVTDHGTGLMWENKEACVGGESSDTEADPEAQPDSGGDLSNPHCVANRYTWNTGVGGTEPNGTLYTDFLRKLNDLVAPNDGNETICFAGFCDWRIPTVGELRNILLAEAPLCPSSPCMDPLLGAVQQSRYWSSSSGAGDPTLVWIVDFGTGEVFENFGKDGLFHARAVRGAQ